MSFGFDLASVDGNKPPHWADVIQTGASFIWYRASFAYFDPSNKAWVCQGDVVMHRDWGTVPSKLVRGAYMFPVLEATQSPEEQVGVYFNSVKNVGGLKPGVDFPPALDVEFPGGIARTGLDRAGVIAWLRRAVAEIKRVFGCLPVIYTSGRVWNDSDADCLGNPAAPDLVNCPLWLARYPYKTRIQAILPPPSGLISPPVPTPWALDSSFWVHQYQGDALATPGFTATVDLNKFNVLSPGDHDPRAKWVKRKLTPFPSGLFGTPMDVTSDKYDLDTVHNVKLLQMIHDLAQDGIIGPRTFAVLAWI